MIYYFTNGNGIILYSFYQISKNKKYKKLEFIPEKKENVYSYSYSYSYSYYHGYSMSQEEAVCAILAVAIAGGRMMLREARASFAQSSKGLALN